MNNDRTLTLDQIKGVIKNQSLAEKQLGATDEEMEFLENFTSDLIYLLGGGYIIGGARM